MGDAPPSRPERRRLLTSAWARVRVAGPRVLALLLGMQIVIIAVCLPIIQWLFREAIRAAGMTGLDLGALTSGPGLTITVALLLVITLFAFWIVAVQYTLLVIALELTGAGVPLTPRAFGRELGRITRKLIRPSAIPIQLYLFVLLPLTGFGFTSTLTQGIAIPPFISGELMKSTASAVTFGVFVLGMLLLNIRLCLAVPLFVLTEARGSTALRTSWRLTRKGRAFPLVFASAAVLLVAAFVTLILVSASLVPTALTDVWAPNASPVVAAYSLGVAQTLGFFLTGLVTTMLVALLIEFLTRHHDETMPGRFVPGESAPGREHSLDHRRIVAGLTVAAVIAAASLGTAALTTLERLSKHPQTLVLAHRGFSQGGVENTLSGLEAAAAAGTDLVEMDVMQTADGGFVAMHDANLSRLTGTNVGVKDLTLDEITKMTVTDQHGQSDRIPSFSEYVQHAAALELPLLIEIKPGGADLPGLVDDLVAELESLNALDSNIYHSLDASSVARLKQLRPDLTVGYTMAFAAVSPPDTTADFIVVEEWTASEHLQHAAQSAGLGFMAWTVNSEKAQESFMRSGVDGIITDRPDLALQTRASIVTESGLVGTLIHLLGRFVVVF